MSSITPSTSADPSSALLLRAHVITDVAGDIVHMDAEGARLLNVGLRFARGKALLPFICEQRVEFAKAMRFVPSCGVPAREALVRPREKRPVPATIALRQHPDGIEWVIAFPPPALGG